MTAVPEDTDPSLVGEKTLEVQKTRRLIANEMKNHPKVARKYLSEWIAGIEKQNWIDSTQQGIDKRIETAKNKSGTTNIV